MAGHVFEKHDCRFNLANDSTHMRPKVSRIILSTTLAGDTEGLAVVDNGSVRDVGFVFINGNVVYGSDATGFVCANLLPSVFVLHKSNAIAFRDKDGPIGSLMNNSPFNDILFGSAHEPYSSHNAVSSLGK